MYVQAYILAAHEHIEHGVFHEESPKHIKLAGENKENTVNKKNQINQKKSKKSNKTHKKSKILKNQTKKVFQSNLSILSTNAASLKHKEEDLKDKVKFFESAIFAIQETNFTRKGSFKINQYEIFEAIRKGKQGGGSMMGVHVSLEPVLVRECSETFELITVEITVGNKQIRVITGYGPQENWKEDEKMPFFSALEEEIAAAELEGKSVIIAMDANSKLGPENIKGDPHEKSENGKILESIIKRHALVVINGLTDKRKGVITRQKSTTNGVEQSVIDLVITSSNLAGHIEEIHIDEKRQHVLTKNVKVGKLKKHIQSDHNIINTTFNLSWCLKENNVVEVFKFKDKKAKETFKEKTTTTNELTKIAKMDKPIEIVTNKFIKRVQGFIHECFEKVRIEDKVDKTLEDMYNQRRVLRSKTDEISQAKLEKIEDELAVKYSEKMVKTILNEVKDMSKSDEGGLNTGKLWNLKKKLMPRNNEPPTAMMSKEGKLLTDKEEIKEEAVRHYKQVFEEKEIDAEYMEYKKDREELCLKRLEETKSNKTEDWSIEKVKKALNDLKTGKSKDPFDIPNELFKPDVAGNDLVEAVAILMNRIKKEAIVPEKLNVCNVTNLYKNKGDKTQYDSYRGIFRTTVLRNILEKLLHNDEYDEIDKNLTDCNVGSRKGRNVRDNLFVINAVMNENKNKSEGSLDINVYDVAKCFDSLWLSECINDLYETGLKNDKLNLLYEANKSASIAIKTSSGVTDRFDIKNTVMQGTVWGGLLCTSTMDKVCKNVYNEDSLLYKYRQSIAVPPLQMVDDIITASKCGATSRALNSTVNEFIKMKKLNLSEKKCAKIHVGSNKTKENCQDHKVKEATMKSSSKEKYLGDFITDAANAKETVKDRKRKGYGILAEITAILKDIPLGNKRTRVGLELRHAMFLNGMLYNSETWTGLNLKDIKQLEVIDHKILRVITGAHSKAPLEMLYLETGELDIPSVMSVRRLLFWHNIIRRHTKELISQVYHAMKLKPIKGDWINLLKSDLDNIKLSLDNEPQFAQMKKEEFKKIVKQKVKEDCFAKMERMKDNHTKVKDLIHTRDYKVQEYMISNKVTHKISKLIFNLRSNCVNEFRSNFRNLNPTTLCPLCLKHEDTQQLALACEEVAHHLTQEELNSVKYDNLGGNVEDQAKIANVFLKIIKVREKLATPGPADRGIIPDPVAII